tara:strand:- start:350 stop:1297 length:948 start_codon:yes stop_codon:yes gene_type:complete
MDNFNYYCDNIHLLGIQGMNKKTIQSILERAQYFNQKKKNRKNKILKDNLVINLFFENSTRTKASFEIAAKSMSADILNISVSSSLIKKGETLADTATTLNAMHPDFLILRHPNSGAAEMLSKHVECSIINAGDGRHEHPTQALLEAAVIKEEGINLDGLKIAICGDILNSRVALSNIYLLTTMGAQVSVIGPPTLIPKGIERMGVKVFFDLDSGLKSSDIIMILRLQNERMDGSETPSKREYYSFFGINENNLKLAKKNALVMHPVPMNRGVEIASLLAENNEISLLKKHVEIGVSVRIACLEMLKLSRNKLLK